ncbi:MAG: BrnT family toxin, partial [Clostridiales bacterium]|nr:BrnT family toxin [Clostridiales bacterium]
MIYNDFFEWDETKNNKNILKHGVNFIEASTVFRDTQAVILDDISHSYDEDRFIIIGVSEKQRMLIVCHCYRGNDELIRIISARKANKE